MKRLFFPAVSLLVLALLLVLGTWQLARLEWKETLLASIQSRVSSAPVPLVDLEQRLQGSADPDYWPVIATGIFEHNNERHFFATHKGLSGYYIYTPLRLPDDRVLFVNRGFVPFDRKDPETRSDGQIGGAVTITGLARSRLDKKPSWIVPRNDPAKNIYYWKDLDEMARQGGYDLAEEVAPLFIDADDAKNPGGLPVGGVTIIDMPNNHLQYAITWFGLAAALAGVFGVWLWRRYGTAAAPPGA